MIPRTVLSNMENKSGSLDYWRKFFRSANSDIFEVIESAILVAASDCPKEFRIRRDQIAEKLFSCRLSRCFGCDRVELQVPEEEEEDVDNKRESEKESKVDCSSNEPGGVNKTVSNYSYDEAEALTEEIDEESQIVGEVLRIKEILANQQDESDSVLFESLRRLQLMALSVETLKATEIGKAVNVLRKHSSKQIRHLVRTLIGAWKVLVDEWVNTAAAIAEGTPDSVNPSVLDEEEGLPSPPLDEGAFLATQTTSITLSEFFDGMDDYGNPPTSGEFNRNQEIVRKPEPEKYNPVRKQQPLHYSNVCEDNNGLMRKQEAVTRQTKPQEPMTKYKPPRADSGPGRPAKVSYDHKANADPKFQQRQDPSRVQKKPPTSLQDMPNYSDDTSVRAKLEVAKRKLHERYQEAENAKKQRTIQVMELHDLPKQGNNQKQSFLKARNQNRNWANGRH